MPPRIASKRALAAANADAPATTSGQFAFWAAAYALILIYSSTLVGPTGVNFVSRDPLDALRALLSAPYQVNGSDQRADWIANVLLLAPLGYLLAGALAAPRQMPFRRLLAASLAFAGCVGFILILKYAQLFFPPRTVSLNYILAQSVGAFCGVAGFCLAQGRIRATIETLRASGPGALRLLLATYTIGLLLFYLYPFDFALGLGDLRHRMAALPEILLSWPGAGRATAIRAALTLAGTAATVPVGMYYGLSGRRASPLWTAAIGVLAMSLVTAATMLVLSTTPFLVAILYRSLGFMIGAAFMQIAARSDIRRWIWLLGRAVPCMAPLYLVVLLAVNGLLTTDWRLPGDGLAPLRSNLLLPLWTYYIVSKAQAAQSIAAHFLMYAPIGAMLSLWRGAGRTRGGFLAAVLAVLLCAAVELARLMHAEAADPNDLLIAALAAAGAVKATAFFCRLLIQGVGMQVGRREAEPAAPPPSAPPLPPVSVTSAASAPGHERQWSRTTRLLQSLVAITCLGLAAFGVWRHPFAPTWLGVALACYALALWRWPLLWLAVIPAVLPSVDLAPWTGWYYVGESDLFILATIAVLAWRAPPPLSDCLPDGAARYVVLFFACALALSAMRGLALDFVPAGGSANPYLRPDNAIRLVKGFVAALLLFPFLKAGMRAGANVLLWLGVGMMAGVALVSLATMAERVEFTGLLDFHSDYRVVATFSSMHVGGGHIGAYLAMALPFLAVPLLRPRWLPLLAMLAIGAAGGYALAITFARTAYAAALVAVLVLSIGWIMASLRRPRPWFRWATIPTVMLFGVAAAGISAAAGTFYMRERIEQLPEDAITRENNWLAGLRLRNDDLETMFFGMGLGTYPRLLLARSRSEIAATNFAIHRDAGQTYLAVAADSPTYIDQKLRNRSRGPYRISLLARSADGKGGVAALLCEKMLLYSRNCTGPSWRLKPGGEWTSLEGTVGDADFSQRYLGVLQRPVVLSLSGGPPGSLVDIANVHLRDWQGRELLENGDFERGMERWYFTDDQHTSWRILDQYLMTLFEGGVAGLAALLLLMGCGIVRAVGAAVSGEKMGAIIAASLAAFACSCIADAELEAPRLASVFFLVVFAAFLVTPDPGASRPAR